MHLIDQLKEELLRRRQADDAALEAIISRSHSAGPADVANLADLVQRTNLDLNPLRQRIDRHLAEHARRERLGLATRRKNDLAADLHQRKAYAALMGTVTVEQLRDAAEGGVVRFSNDPTLQASWLRGRGWKLVAGSAWRREAENAVAFDAVKRQTEAELDPIRPALLAHLASLASPPAPEPVPDADPAGVEAAGSAMEADLAALPAIDPATMQLITAAEAALGCYGGEASPWLTARGWKVDGVHATDPSTNIRFAVMPSAADSQFKRDTRPIESDLRKAVVRAGERAVSTAGKSFAEPAIA